MVLDDGRVGRALAARLNFAPAVALVLLRVALGRVIGSVQLVLVVVVMELRLVILHQMAGNIFWRRMAER